MYLIFGFIVIGSILFVYFKNRAYFKWKEKNFHCNNNFIKDFSEKHNYFSKSPLIGKVSKDGIEDTQNLLLEIHKTIKNPQKRMFATGEILSKILAYRELFLGLTVDIPHIDIHKSPVLDKYSIDTIFDINNMPAFGLLSETATPLILFRGTDFSLSKKGLASIFSDLDISGPGFKAFIKSKKNIGDWLEYAFNKTKKKTKVFGFSLGGAFCYYILLFENKYLSKDSLQPSMIFNPPGVSKKNYKQWYIGDRDFPFLVFITKNDLISRYGSLCGKVYKVIPSKSYDPIHAHIELMIAQDSYNIVKLDS